jgi:hypothetical protein
MVQTHAPTVDSIICREVTSLVSCTFDDLVRRLPVYSWAQVFSAVDRLSRQGALTVSLRKTGSARHCSVESADSIDSIITERETCKWWQERRAWCVKKSIHGRGVDASMNLRP